MSDFVNFKLAQKLKDKGFEWVKITTYNPKTKVRTNHLEPTIAQVLKWLREEKKIHIAIGYSGETKWRYVVIHLDDAYFCNPNITKKRFDKCEQAALAGIEYVLDNLI